MTGGRWILALLIVGALSIGSCDHCCGDVVAEVAQARGNVQRDRRESQGQFAKVAVADSLRLGDGLRTGPNSQAELKLFPDGTARIEERTLVRFMSERPDDGVERLSIVEGIIEIDARTIDLELDTGHGLARVSRGGSIRARAPGPNDVQLDVLIGRVQIERPGESGRAAAAGETLVLASPEGPPTAQPQLPPSEPPPDAAASGEPANATDETPAAAEAPPMDRGDLDIVTDVDFRLNELENAIVHAPSMPVQVALPLSPCSEPRTVALGKGKPARLSASAKTVALRLRAGTQELTIHCGRDSRRLILRVVRDAATQELPRSAPVVEVAADGRRYTVRYQNLLPSVTFRWPGAVPSARYSLHVKRSSLREQSFEIKEPKKQLRSGDLVEGSYAFWFQSADGARSKESALRISFDNTARSAYLSAPADHGTAGREVRVAGVALLRSQVSVGGVSLETDAQGRFDAAVPHAPRETAIAVRVSHPATGVHYYLRRLR